MIWKRMNSTEANKIICKIEEKTAIDFGTLVEGWKAGKFSDGVDAEYREIRDKIYAVYNNYKDQDNYEIDLRIGLALYELFLEEKYKLNPIHANDDDIWRYLSVRVFLDITYLRHPKNDRFGKYFSHDRAYKYSKRIWVKQLWWWIHLAWQGDVDTTYEVLNKFGSGCISQILERAGKGYRVDITRPLFKTLYDRCETGKILQETFSAVMMLYYAKMFVVEPTLVKGGIDSFVDKIIDEKIPRSKEDGSI